MDVRYMDIMELKNCTLHFHLVNGDCIIGKVREIVKIRFGGDKSEVFVKVVSQNASDHLLAFDKICNID